MQTEFSIQKPERLFVQLTDIIVPFGYAQHGVPIKAAIHGADIEPAVVIRDHTESDFQPPTHSAGNRDRFPILNIGECDVHSDGQEGLLVQKLCNTSGGGHFKEKQASRASQKIMVDDEGSDFQASFPDFFADYQNPPLTRGIDMGNKAWGN